MPPCTMDRKRFTFLKLGQYGGLLQGSPFMIIPIPTVKHTSLIIQGIGQLWLPMALIVGMLPKVWSCTKRRIVIMAQVQQFQI